jgi:hypothetical protein
LESLKVGGYTPLPIFDTRNLSACQIHGYAKAGRWKVAILYCDGYLWLLVMDPKNPDDPFLSEVIMSTDAATATEVTQTEVGKPTYLLLLS